MFFLNFIIFYNSAYINTLSSLSLRNFLPNHFWEATLSTMSTGGWSTPGKEFSSIPKPMPLLMIKCTGACTGRACVITRVIGRHHPGPFEPGSRWWMMSVYFGGQVIGARARKLSLPAWWVGKSSDLSTLHRLVRTKVEVHGLWLTVKINGGRFRTCKKNEREGKRERISKKVVNSV